ncbi:hypothetical protein [Aurantiacibacter sediminis]|uniref:Uncharacterized protein n=1 Tax=Aurantiacibacter sediminis TaxID=2793064 RepID=A0ABS0N1I9_9SPHN|nr:hypothetical protein [Aurantiacibacter sediminis]MBH5321826.1 hypothetical protein [Aurantiacibacter sediminis]
MSGLSITQTGVEEEFSKPDNACADRASGGSGDAFKRTNTMIGASI